MFRLLAPIQDSRFYFNYHHTAADTLDKIVPKELAENSAVVAVTCVRAREHGTTIATLIRLFKRQGHCSHFSLGIVPGIRGAISDKEPARRDSARRMVFMRNELAPK